MDYEAVLAQALILLQQEKRLAYRVLKLRLQLDDDTVEALKDDLIYAKRLAVDEEGRVLVWTGGTSSAPPTASPVPLPATPDIAPAQSEAAPVGPATPDAERRQLTVMFCDLVDSTRLSSQLDPEEYRDVVRQYQQVCADVIQRYDGHIAQLLGDGLLVYFGYPHAHDDDAQRAIRAGLGMLAVLGHLNQRLQHSNGLHLAMRLGIHTGRVVIGDMGGPGRQEQLALGEVPNIASRIEGLAAANTVAISAASYRLVQGYFDCEALGAQVLRGVAEPVHVYRILQESGARGRLDVAVTRGLTPLVGREAEVTLLRERWEQAKAGHGQVVLLSGEGGIGKSRLIQVLKDQVANDSQVRWECRSTEYAQNTALFPLIDLFQRLWRFDAQETPEAKVAKLEHALSHYRLPLEESVPLVAPLLSVPLPEHHSPPLPFSPQRQRQKTLEMLVTILLELAEQQPVLFILEDLHWTDPTTLELLNLVIDQTPTASLLVLLTCRPHFQPAWQHRSYLTAMTVHRLSPTHVAQIVTRLTGGKTFPQEVLHQILVKTDGVPLFVEELTKAILESGQLRAGDGHYELVGSFATFAIPATLQDSLMARLDRLVTAKGVAQYAAVIGRQFAYELLQAVSQLDAATLQRELGRLVEAEIVYQRGLPPHSTYVFKHALIQDAAYESLLKSTRQQYHQSIAQVLEAQFPETAETEPELLAQHYTEAGLIVQAIPYWQQAGQQAVERSAYVEAISHFTQGLALLTTLPATPERDQHELTLQIALGVPLLATEGWGSPRMGHAYARARELCQHVGDIPQLCSALLGLWGFYLARAEPRTSREVGEQLLHLAQSIQDASFLLEANLALGNTLVWLGECASARAHLEQGIALYTPQHHRSHIFLYGHEPGVWCRCFVSWALWTLGYPDQALSSSHDALTLAQGSAHPHILANALGYAVRSHQLRRDVQATRACAEAEMGLAREHGFVFLLAEATFFRGWALAVQGQEEEGIAQMRQGLAAWRATGAKIGRTSYLALLAEAHEKVGQAEEGLSALAEALALVDHSGERWWEAELYRLKGELLLQLSSDNQAEAEACCHQSLDIARQQQAKSWELRAATSLARLWQQQGKRQEAHDLLASVYHWFTEGFDTADLRDAKALLDALSEGR
jgi:TOMM system kinase/cyclase fusion protein